MASNDKSDDEILGLGQSSSNNDTFNKEADGEIARLELDFTHAGDVDEDEEMLLLSSPSPPAQCDETKPVTVENELSSNTQNQPTKLSLVHNDTDNHAKSTCPETVEVITDDDDDVLEILDDDSDDDEFEAPANKTKRQSKFCHNNTLDDEESQEDTDHEDFDEDEEPLSDENEIDSCEESNLFIDGKINIFYIHGGFFIWNAEGKHFRFKQNICASYTDVQMLREECRIVGKLTGCLPRAPRQNNQLGLPLQLMPEEAKLLVDIDAAAVVTDDPVSSKMLKIREEAFKNIRNENFHIQQKLYRVSREEEVKHRFKDIIAGKKAKKRKIETSEHLQEGVNIGSTKTRLIASTSGCETTKKNKVSPDVGDSQKAIDTNESETDHLTVEDIVKSETSAQHALVQIFTESPWKQSVQRTFDWLYPCTEKEIMRYLVFRDLWNKGFYLTSGSKFGGDFLVYPGDPARYHSHYIAVCRSQFDEIPSLDIVTLGRLATTVRKTALLCALDKNRKVIYTSLKWTGIT
ncbi:unnamed protein product [Lymnaea stagnalis]|uniref:tRNA-splicing endonuclease subunit SEN34 n=1 Tax=Lymnaea stagnalis TaxID=6523 RepID=A0AAV2I835_LYMST